MDTVTAVVAIVILVLVGIGAYKWGRSSRPELPTIEVQAQPPAEVMPVEVEEPEEPESDEVEVIPTNTLAHVVQADLDAKREASVRLAREETNAFLVYKLETPLEDDGPPEYMFRVLGVIWTHRQDVYDAMEYSTAKWGSKFVRSREIFEQEHYHRDIYSAEVRRILKEADYIR